MEVNMSDYTTHLVLASTNFAVDTMMTARPALLIASVMKADGGVVEAKIVDFKVHVKVKDMDKFEGWVKDKALRILWGYSV